MIKHCIWSIERCMWMFCKSSDFTYVTDLLLLVCFLLFVCCCHSSQPWYPDVSSNVANVLSCVLTQNRHEQEVNHNVSGQSPGHVQSSVILNIFWTNQHRMGATKFMMPRLLFQHLFILTKTHLMVMVVMMEVLHLMTKVKNGMKNMLIRNLAHVLEKLRVVRCAFWFGSSCSNCGRGIVFFRLY